MKLQGGGHKRQARAADPHPPITPRSAGSLGTLGSLHEPSRRALAEADTDRLLDVREAATLLAVKPATLYQWAYQRRIPVVKLMGRALRFRLSDIEKLIAHGMRPARRSFDDSVDTDKRVR